MTTCIRCHRPLKRPTETGMGDVCARKTKAQALQEPVRDLLGYDLDMAEAFARERVQVTIAAGAADAHMAVRRAFIRARVQLLGWAP